MPQTFDEVIADVFTVKNDTIPQTAWPKLTCGVANEVTFQDSNLKLGDQREVYFQNAGQLRANADIRFLTGAPTATEKLRILPNGNVGIGTTSPQARLQVSGGAIMPAVGNSNQAGIQFPSNPGGGVGDEAFIRYFATVGEMTKLQIGIGNESNDSIGLVQAGAERLTINNGCVGIGTMTPEGTLDVRGDIRAGNSDIYFTKTDHNHTGIGNTTGFAAIENAANYDALMILGRAGTALGRKVRLWDYLEVNGPLDVTGALSTRGELSVPNTGGGSARLSNATFNNEGSFQNNNVKLIMGNSGIVVVGSPPLTYEFAVGHTSSFLLSNPFRFVTNFTKRFSINQNGDAFFAGAKSGYVVDHFVNRVGDALEQGDVVVISKHESAIYSGTDNNIPLPEVDLTDQAYDKRVCGIVAQAVTEHDLPFVESEIAGVNKDLPHEHPLKTLAAPAGDQKQVPDQQMGIMVTLGAYAHCKVDADIAPIEVGDLLTTSPTKGHAQKAIDPSKATGAIIGKALGSLKTGKGKIPVMVMLQ